MTLFIATWECSLFIVDIFCTFQIHMLMIDYSGNHVPFEACINLFEFERKNTMERTINKHNGYFYCTQSKQVCLHTF